MKTRLEKFNVCTDCYSVGIMYADCICVYDNHHSRIDLEFEVCECCGNLVSDGNPADTPFNDMQIHNHKVTDL